MSEESGMTEPIRYDWAIRSIVKGADTTRIIECKHEEEARDWCTRFPQSYALLKRRSAGHWMAA